MKSERYIYLLGILCIISICLPLFGFGKHSCCIFGEQLGNCVYINNDYGKGICVVEAINEICNCICVIWGILIFSVKYNSLCTYVAMVLLLALSIFLAFVDHSKILLATLLSISFLIFVVIVFIANKIDKHEKKNGKEIPRRP